MARDGRAGRDRRVDHRGHRRQSMRFGGAQCVVEQHRGAGRVGVAERDGQRMATAHTPDHSIDLVVDPDRLLEVVRGARMSERAGGESGEVID